jgi:outer membrane protein OmpA-like peptidoglycan-associated protein
MKRTLAGLLVLLAIAGLAAADPALGGGRGLFRLYDARVEEDGALVWANRVVFHRYFDSQHREDTRGPVYGMELSYAPFEFVEVWGSLLGAGQHYDGDWRYDYQGFGTGGKLAFPYLPVFKPALVVNYLNEHSGHIFPDFMNGLAEPGASWRLVGAARLWDLHKTLPTFIVNYGRGFASGSNAFLGAGMEMASDAFDVFVEARSEQVPGKSFLVTPVRTALTPGVRIKVPYFHLTGGVELGLNKEPIQFIAGFNLVSPFPKPKPRPWGQLAGRVEDALTGKPVAAEIKFKNRRVSPFKSNAGNGTFYLAKGPVGAVILEASAEGYNPEVAALVVPEFGYATYTFKLRSANPVGTIAGRVYDAATNKPLAATVIVGDESISADEETGFFRFDGLSLGLHGVKAEMGDYVADERIVEVEESRVAKVEVGLKTLVAAAPARSVALTGIFKGKVMSSEGKPIPATVSFGGKAPNAQADANGLFQAELPTGPYEINIAAPSHQSQFGVVNVDPGATVEKYFVLTALAQGEVAKPEPIKKPVIFTLKGVLFDFNMASLREDAYPNLQDAVRILKENADIRVEVQGFTDDVGTEEYNLGLSERRAETVVSYLVSTGGIAASRLVARGFGENQFVASNATEEGRQQNRRVEFVIVK